MQRTIVIDVVRGKKTPRDFFADGEMLDAEANYLYPFRMSNMSDWRDCDFLDFFSCIKRSFVEKNFCLKILTSEEEYRLLAAHLPPEGFSLEKALSPAQRIDDSTVIEKPIKDTPKETNNSERGNRLGGRNDPVAETPPDATRTNQSASSFEQESSIESFEEVKNRMEELTEEDCISAFSFNSSMLEAEYNRIVSVHSNLKLIQTFFLRRQLGDANHIIYIRGIGNDGKMLCCGSVATTLLETTLDGEADFRIHEWRKE